MCVQLLLNAEEWRTRDDPDNLETFTFSSESVFPLLPESHASWIIILKLIEADRLSHF